MNLMNLSNQSKAFGLAILAVLAFMMAPQLMAIPVPAAPYDDLGGQAYDLVFNKAYDSGLSYVIALGMGVIGFMQLKQNWKETAGWGVGATGVATMPAIVTTLGFMF